MRLRVLRQRDRRVQQIAVGVHHAAVAVQLELAGARVSQIAARCSYLKEPVPLNHQIQRIRRLREISLRENDFVGGRARTQAELQSARHGGLSARRRSRLNHGLVHQILKLRTARLKAGSVGVRQIVGDIIDVHLLSGHAAGRAVESSNHNFSYPLALYFALRAHPSHLGESLLVHVGCDRDGLLQHFELPHQPHQAHRGLGRRHV